MTTEEQLTENVTALIGPPATPLSEKEKKKIDYAATKAPNFSAENQPGKKKKKK